MKKNPLLPLFLILLFQLIGAVRCNNKFPIPESYINGNFMAKTWVFSDTSGHHTLIDTLTPCQKNTVLRFDLTNHVYQVLLPDSACPLIVPFNASGSWKIVQTKDNFVLDDQSFNIENVSTTQFDLLFPGAYQGRPGTFRETLYKQ